MLGVPSSRFIQFFMILLNFGGVDKNFLYFTLKNSYFSSE